MRVRRAGYRGKMAYEEPSGFNKAFMNSRNRRQDLAILKEHITMMETQIQDIFARIRRLNNNRSFLTQVAEIDADVCTGCLRCFSVCAANAIIRNRDIPEIDKTMCTGCGLCVKACPQNAIQLKKT